MLQNKSLDTDVNLFLCFDYDVFLAEGKNTIYRHSFP
jgi:hypothetical protein